MESILLSFHVMLPVFLTILLGVFLQKIGLMPRRMIRDLNRLCFKVFFAGDAVQQCASHRFPPIFLSGI